MSKCLINGCALYDLAREEYLWSDLHEEGDCFIFLGTTRQPRTDEEHKVGLVANWLPGDPTHAPSPPGAIRRNLMVITMATSARPFTRGGFVVVRKDHCSLNEPALTHINHGLDVERKLLDRMMEGRKNHG